MFFISNNMNGTISHDLARLNIFVLIVLFSALYETINMVAAGTDSVVVLKNITVLRSRSGEGSELGLQRSANVRKANDRCHIQHF